MDGRKTRRMNRILSGVLAGLLFVGTFVGTDFVSMKAKAADEPTARVTLEEAEHGSIAFAETDERELDVTLGDTVTIEAVPDEGYVLDSVSAIDETGTASALAVEDCSVDLTVDKPVRVLAIFREPDTSMNENEEAFAVLEPEAPTSRSSMQDSKDYILEHMDREKVGNGNEMTVGDIMHVTTSIFDGAKLERATFEALLEDKDGDDYKENYDAMLNQGVIYIPLYDIDENAEYFVGRAVSPIDHATVTDWSAGENNTDAVLFDDIELDTETGLVYVPKSHRTEDGEHTYVGGTRLQVLMTIDNVNEAIASFSIIINADGVKGTLADTGLVSTSVLDLETDIQITKDEKALKDLRADSVDSVEINGIEYKSDGMWSYDEDTGVLTIYACPSSLTDVQINLSETVGKDIGRFFDKAGDFFKGIFSVDADAAVIPGKLKFKTQPTVGMRFNVSASVIHDDRGDADDRTGDDWVAAGYTKSMAPSQYISAGSENEKVYQDLVNNVNVTGVAMQDVYRDVRRLVHIGNQTVDDVSIPEMNVLLQCAHVRVPFTYDGVDFNDNTNGTGWGNDAWVGGVTGAINQTVNISIVAVGNKTVIIGIISPRGKSQTGGGYFEIEYELDGGQVYLQKQSANPNCTTGNDAYKMTGAKYGIFSDAACTQSVATLTVQNENGITDKTEKLPSGTYYVKELPSTEIRGYKINPNVKAITINGGDDKLIKLDGNMLEDAFYDPVDVLAQKAISGTGEGGTLRGDITSLAGIKFRIDYYKGLYNSAEEAQASGKLGASAIFQTVDRVTESGTVRGSLNFRTSKPVDGTSWPYLDAGENYLPLGTTVVTEVSSMEGTVTRTQASVLQIVDAGNGRTQRNTIVGWGPQGAGADLGSDVATIENTLIEGSVMVLKVDADSRNSNNQGNGDLVGVEYEIVNKSANPIDYEGTKQLHDASGTKTTIPVDGVVTKITSVRIGDQVVARADHLPYGSYIIREAKASLGYNKAAWEQPFSIETNGQVVSFNRSNNRNANAIKRGSGSVVKVDRDTKRSMPQGNADLAGASFDIYNKSANPVYVHGAWYAVDAKIGTMTTEWDARTKTYVARMDDLPFGSYLVVETTAPTGYHKADYSLPFSITEDGQVVELDNCEEPVWRSGEVLVVKADRDWHRSEAQGDATFEGVKYDLINRSRNDVYVNGTLTEPGDVVMTLTTAWNEAEQKYTASTSGLPYGSYELREVEASEGYLNAGWTQTFDITEDGQTKRFESRETDWNENAVMRGGVIVGKVDRETEQYTPLGEAHLDGATFDIINHSRNAVYVNGQTYAVGEVVMTIAAQEMEWNGDTIYAATTGDRVLPYGTYEVKETASGTGYLYDSQSKAWTKTFKIREDGQMVDYTDEAEAVKNQVIREDWHFQKKAEDTMERMDQIAFLVESLTTGERHVIVTDENGTWGSAWVQHSMKTNENDPTSPISNGALAVDEDGNWYVADSSKLNFDSGVWFTGLSEDLVTWNADGTSYTVGEKAVHVRDDLRAFPYDTYRVQELRCANNEGYGLVSFTVTLHRYGNPDGIGLDIDYGTIDDREISIGTTLMANEDACFGDADSEITLTDTVTYGNLMVGTHYTLKGEIHGVNADGTDAGVIATAEVPFTPTTASGRTNVTFTVPASAITTPSIVAFEYLKINNTVVASHEDITDENQTVKIPEIGTTLTGDLDHMANADADEIVLTDTIAYRNFQVGKEYLATGTLMDKESGEAILGSDGSPITATATFTATAENDTVDVTFRFGGVDLAGKTVVAFEEVMKDGKKYAVHTDIEDEEQSVFFPSVDSFAADALDANKDLRSDVPQTIREVVTLTNLADGYEYKLVGTLHVCENGEDLGELLHEDETPYQAEDTFTGSESVRTMLFEDVDVRELGGKDLVVFQMLYGRKDTESDWVLLGSGADISDDDESVRIPKVGTTLVTGQTIHEAQVPEDGRVTLTDTVAYENLTPGHAYAIIGKLHMQDTDEDGNTIDGGEVEDATAIATFVPEEADGTVDLTFTFNASDMDGHSVTAFETLYSSPKSEVPDEWKEYFETRDEDVPMDEPADDWKVAEHVDIEDEGQTVHFVDLGTTLLASNRMHETEVPKNDNTFVTLIDTVSYKNLIPGKEYTMRGTLHTKVTDEAGNVTDGGAVLDSEGNEITAETTFVPTEADGTVDVKFEFDAKDLGGKTVVAFESVSTEGVTFGVHADIEDEDQTVQFVNVHTTALTGEGLHEAQVSENGEMTIVDTVAYENVIPGTEYTITGTLHKQEISSEGTVTDGGAILDADGNELTMSKTFIAEEANGTIELIFTFDASELSGQTVTAFEKLSKNGVTVATHTDITDEEQSVHFVELHTTATSGNGMHETEVPKGEDKTVTITDRVRYTNLIPGTEYALIGVLHVQGVNKDGEIIDDGALESTKQVMTFTPETSDGYVDMIFTVDAAELTGKTVTAFETLEKDGVIVAVHADITDEEQSVHIVEIHTTALGENGSHMTQVAADGKVTLTDRVEYKNLIPGATYKVAGTLHVREVGDDGSFTDGGAVKASNEAEPVKLTEDSTEESTEAPVEESTEESTEVSIEESTEASVEESTEESTEEPTEAPTEESTEESTEASVEESTEESTEVPTEESMEASTEESTEAPVEESTETPADEPAKDLTDEAEVLTAETTFVPHLADGYVDVTFTFDASELAGKTVVAFETLTRDDVVVATHEDIEDEDQSVYFVKIRTKATAENGTHEMELPEGENETVTVTDLVEYKNLIPGLTYKMSGEVHVQSVDANGNISDMGTLANANGSPVSAEATFVPESADGSIELTFTMATTGLGNRTVVVFETLTQDDVVIATHADITDKHQSVSFKAKEQTPVPIAKPEPPREIVKTGQTPLYVLFITLGIALMAGAGYVIFRKKRIK